ncbi:MAG: hypothetical protein COS99_03060 [Candidatus Omnitrophica bacterium CG07_land_8_20_14_0_80_42_15]|uniref:DUF4013 domain-containing protein n=1 Tax=Candidatus Aquitaenariimonas noxiae TaxID=1974741 RepID=A0A2J0KZP3_9BACT|nr:MAG: hypothetical protein COS99_03060 [Candidatus Omnitrophica bacterium CG07_land_8_20_14_0_80_42_15]
MVADIENVFKFAFKDKNWIIKMLIGGVLAIIPVVNFIVFGYVLKVLKDAKEGKEARLPEWEDFGALFKDGLTVFIIVLAYALIICIIWLIGILISIIPVIGCLSLLLFPILIAALILIPPAANISLCRYLDKGTIKEALKLKEVLEEFKSKFSDYLMVTLINAAIGLIASVTFCLAPFIYFWLWLITARLFGEIYGTRPTKFSI